MFGDDEAMWIGFHKQPEVTIVGSGDVNELGVGEEEEKINNDSSNMHV